MVDSARSEEKLWMDKYIPTNINELTFHNETTQLLMQLAKKDDFPHMIFYGPEGAGKKTRIRIFLSEVFGQGIFKMNNELKVIKNNSTSIEFSIISSNYHIEITPSDSEYYDRYIVQNIIKETASLQNIDFKQGKKFKVIVIHEADNLTKEAQFGLRRTMEKYMGNCRIIMTCTCLSKIQMPVRSRCLSIRIPSPTNEDVKKLLKDIKMKENLSMNDKMIDAIVENSNRNIRKAINTLQISCLECYKTEVYIPEYDISIKGIVNEIFKEQSASTVKKLREAFLKLLVNGVPPDFIFINMIKEILKKQKSEKFKISVINAASLFENRTQNGNKPLFHIEAFLAKIMYLIADKSY